MLDARKNLARAFTLIEILCVVVILGIAAAIIMPQISSRDDLKVAAAARVLMADLIYAQNRAITYQTNHCVKFDLASKRYSEMNGSPLAVMTHPVNKTPYTEIFGSGGTSGLTECTLLAVDLRGSSNTQQYTLGFDDLGTPLACHSDGSTETLTSGFITLQCGTMKLKITVEPYTGQLTVASTP